MEKSKQKIMFIEPPFYRLYSNSFSLDRYPLALGYLAGTVKTQTNWQVLAYNADFTQQSETPKLSYLTGEGYYNFMNNLENFSAPVWSDIKTAISQYKPAVIGISAKSQNHRAARMIAKIAKELDKNIIVIIGGPHPSMSGAQILECPDIDISVKGEGERTIVELLQRIEKNLPLKDVNGIFFRQGNEIIATNPRELIEDLDSLCFPHENAPLLLKDFHKYPKKAFRNIFTTRGCPYECFYCGSRNIWTRRVRSRSPMNVVSEIKVIEKMGTHLLHFDDDIFGVSKKHTLDLCEALAKNFRNLKWSCELHVRLVDDEVISKMSKAGCYCVYLGIESGNNDMLKKIKKNITIEDAAQASKIIKKHGLELSTFFMAGFPQETEASLKDTFEAIKKIKCDTVIYSIFTPYPGTEAFEFSKTLGLIGEDFDISKYNHQSPANHFCANISAKNFRKISGEIEKYVDRKKSFNNLKALFSPSFIKKVLDFGLANSFKRGAKILTGRAS